VGRLSAEDRRGAEGRRVEGFTANILFLFSDASFGDRGDGDGLIAVDILTSRCLSKVFSSTICTMSGNGSDSSTTSLLEIKIEAFVSSAL
jgi:hypothetical protein